MRNIICTSLIVGLSALPALAGPPEGCYVRHYTDDHLARNPAQVVASMWLSFAQWGDEHIASLGVAASNQGHVQGTTQAHMYMDQSLFCWRDDGRGKDAWSCSVDCDGGVMRITRDDGKVLEFSTRYLMVGDTEGCGGAMDLAEQTNTPVTYRLYPVDDAQCESN